MFGLCLVLLLPLQLLRRAHPEWADAPLAVIEDDHPQARVEHVDARARSKRIRVGQRYAAALQLSRDLCVQYKTAFVLAHKLREAMAAETRSPSGALPAKTNQAVPMMPRKLMAMMLQRDAG